MREIWKGIGSGITILTFIFSLISSWTFFYSEQKVQGVQLASQDKIISRHEEELKNLINQQGRTLEIIVSLSKDVRGVQEDIKELVEMNRDNQMYLTKIASKVGVNK